MAETLTASPASLSFTRIKDRPVHHDVLSKPMTVTSSTSATDIAITASDSWIGTPVLGTCDHGVAFDISVDRDNLPAESGYQPVNRSGTITFTKAAHDDLVLNVSVQVLPGGPPAKRRR